MIQYSKPYIHYKVIVSVAEENMKLLIAGSRSIKEYDFKKYIPEGTTLIITGGAAGVDTLAEKYADELGLSKLIIRPKYDVYGKFAPLKRNQEMVEMCDVALIIWDGKSRGTKYTVDYAYKMGKQVILKQF